MHTPPLESPLWGIQPPPLHHPPHPGLGMVLQSIKPAAALRTFTYSGVSGILVAIDPLISLFLRITRKEGGLYTS